MKYTLRQLQVFLEVAHYQNISKAAEALAMSQSAASSALLELEKQFDIKLFDRIGKRLQINELGNQFRPQAQALIDQANQLEQEFNQHQTIGTLRLGATLTIGNYLAVNMMADFMAEHPGSNLSLAVENTETICNMVSQFELDLGMIEGEIKHPDLVALPWIQDELVVFCSPNHPFAKKQKLLKQDLLEASWILRESGSGTRQSFDRAMAGILPQLDIKLELQHTEGIKRAVEAQLGIACLSNITLREAFIRKSLVPLDVPNRSFKRQLYVVIRKNKFISPGIEAWLKACNLKAPN